MDQTFATNTPEARHLPRSNMFLAAVLSTSVEQAPVKVRNMSAKGAMIETPLLPALGSDVHLIRGPLSVRAGVVWSRDNKCGLRFQSEVSVKNWMAPPGNVEQQRVDQIVALVKAGGALPPAAPAPDSLAAASTAQLAEDIKLVFRLIEQLGDDLADSPETLMRHEAKLQNLDVAMQMLAAIEKEMGGNSPTDGQSMARLHDLRAVGAQALARD
ncbi:MAG: PilZ domain-containing protein [Sphingomicrobium sp.]